MKVKVGLVLSSLPAYSETFFRNLIRLIKESTDMEITLYVDQASSRRLDVPCKTVVCTIPDFRHPFRFVKFIGVSLQVITFRSRALARLWRLNYLSGFTTLANLKSVILSSHILTANLDWLHFGFGTLAINRENLALAIKAKLLVSFRGFDHYIYPLKHPGCYDILFTKVDVIHVLSEGIKRSIINNGVDAAKIKVITPAIDTSLFAVRDGLKVFRRNEIKIVTIARLHWIKGLEYVINAMAILKRSNIDFALEIIGEGVEKERLQFAVYQQSLGSNVVFVGKLEPKEIVKHLLEADIYLQYSLQEGFCNAVLEAQAMGLFCIVSDAEGLQENVLHNQTGWVVPKCQPNLLAQSIEDVMNLPDIAIAEIRNRAINRVNLEFGLELHKQRFRRIYTESILD